MEQDTAKFWKIVMPKVIDQTNSPLNSEYTIGEHEGVLGFILESWGPSQRNREYNAALDTLLARLVALGVPYIRVIVISKLLITRFPNLNDREIIIDGRRDIDLHRISAQALRKEIGRKQAQLKEAPIKSGGNRTKRILLHNPLISRELWKAVAENSAALDSFSVGLAQPTADRVELEARVDALIRGETAKPKGNATPKKTMQISETFERDPEVKAWVLKAAKGVCELCLSNAPFIKENGVAYLEVHHVRPLAEGGKDTIENTVALCPNCHMRMHYGISRLAMRAKLVQTIERLASDTHTE